MIPLRKMCAATVPGRVSIAEQTHSESYRKAQWVSSPQGAVPPAAATV